MVSESAFLNTRIPRTLRDYVVPMSRRVRWILTALLLGGAAAIWLNLFRRTREVAETTQLPHTVASRLEQYGPAVRARLCPLFEAANVDYPPSRMTWLALKDERRLEIHAPDRAGVMRLVASYPILAASGKPGPKLREGDRQVPEGFYRIELLNPNSLFHLSLRVNYPNAFDLEHAEADGRTEPGTDIMIHGSNASVGCLAMGDPAAEDFFVLAADAGLETIELIIAPHDFRVRTDFPQDVPEFIIPVYRRLQAALTELPREREQNPAR